MGTDRAVLERFLRECGRESLVATVTERLEPFFLKAETGAYALAPSSEVAEVRAAGIIAAAIGSPVAAVETLSVSAMLSGMTRGERARHLTASGVTIKDGLWLRLMREHADASGGVAQALYPPFHRALGSGLRAAFERSLRPAIGGLSWMGMTTSLGDVLTLGAWNGLEEAILYWAASVIMDDASRAERLASLLELMASAVPLCESDGRPGTWLMLSG
ncbi:MAG TPA: hypothetical protein VL426_01435 [Candidatus Binatia bacterium]|nr:hypothetical protein [Candidatus Binatia bacterium]